jgi:hypothetical protein
LLLNPVLSATAWWGLFTWFRISVLLRMIFNTVMNVNAWWGWFISFRVRVPWGWF